MISDYEFYSWIVLGAIALVALGAMFLAGRGTHHNRHQDDNYIHYHY